MFEFSLGEMLVVALVALVVLGPERLPKAARLTGLWLRRARAQWVSMKNELEQELAREELARSLREGRQALDEVRAQLQASGDDAATASRPEATAQSAVPDSRPIEEVRRGD